MRHGQCIHFNGVQNELCKRGVRYDQFKDGKPCIQFIEKSARGGTYLEPGEKAAERKPFPNATPPERCPFYAEPSDDEVQKDREELDAAMKRTMAAIKVASEWRVRPKPQADRIEVIECPCCKGRLHLSQSAYNGHVHGKCETDGCVSWME
jgi:hypothetical protein